MKLILSFLCLSVQSAKILHISDIHYDSRYHIGGVEHCYLGSTGLGCCRKNDIPLKPSGYANEWGSYNCDTPIKLLNESLKWISDHIQIDKIIYTGDSVDHHDITQTIGHNLNEIGTVFTLFREYFPDTQLFHILGNHDTYPIDQTPPFIYPKSFQARNAFQARNSFQARNPFQARKSASAGHTEPLKAPSLN